LRPRKGLGRKLRDLIGMPKKAGAVQTAELWILERNDEFLSIAKINPRRRGVKPGLKLTLEIC